MLKKAVFLDRDGTINFDPGYLSDPSQLRLLPRVSQALSGMVRQGYVPVIISNQSGVGRGIIALRSLDLIHQRLNELLLVDHVSIEHIYCCIHRPEEDCQCRKPKPYLLQKAAEEIKIDLKNSFMIGDKLSDLQAGVNAGCRAVGLVRTGYGIETEQEIIKSKKLLSAFKIADDLYDVFNGLTESYR